MVDSLQAIMICEGITEAQDEEEYIQAWQTLLDNGVVWQLQGWYQRYAIELLNRGVLVHPMKE